MTAGQRWTKRKPTEPGWYWHRDLTRPYEDEREPYLVKVREYGGRLCVGNCELSGPPYHGEWQGPLTPNEVTE